MISIELRPIGSAPGYMAGSDGHIYSRRRWRGEMLRRIAEAPNTCIVPYPQVRIPMDGKRRVGKNVHRLVAEAFHGAPESGMVCRHLDGDHTNNTPENLAWGTQAENMQDCRDHGRMPSLAAASRNRKLTDSQVIECRERAAAGESYGSIASDFSVSRSCIGYTVRGKSFAWVV